MMLKHKRYDLRVKRFRGFRLEVYWRVDDFGRGPCLSLYVGKRERLRFDLFDNGAHIHDARIAGAPRTYYPAGLTREQYALRACTDLIRLHPPASVGAGWAYDELQFVSAPRFPLAR